MSRLAHATFAASGLEAERRDLDKTVRFEARERARARGRKPATGRFESRAELCAWVWSNWLNTPAGITDIARQCRVSPGVVGKIIDTNEGRPLSEAQLLACAADVAVLIPKRSAADMWIDRMFNLEFISDQQMSELAPEFAAAGWRDLLRYGLQQVY
jgi:hypothetical protein